MRRPFFLFGALALLAPAFLGTVTAQPEEAIGPAPAPPAEGGVTPTFSPAPSFRLASSTPFRARISDEALTLSLNWTAVTDAMPNASAVSIRVDALTETSRGMNLRTLMFADTFAAYSMAVFELPPAPATFSVSLAPSGPDLLQDSPVATDPEEIPVAESITEPVDEALQPAAMYLLVVSPDRGVAFYEIKPLTGEPTGSQEPATVGTTRSSYRGSGKVVVHLLATDGPLRGGGWTLLVLGAVVVAAGLVAARPEVLGAFPLFSRFKRDEILDHRRRGQLHEAIRACPGVTFGELRERIGLQNGAAQHHLVLLERHGLVRRVRDGRTTRFFLQGPKVEWRPDLPPARQQVLALVRESPGLSATELSRRMGKRVQTTWEQLRLLQASGLVVGKRQGRLTAWCAPS